MINYQERAKSLLELFNNLTWETYIKVSDELLFVDKNKIDSELQAHPRQYSFMAGLLEKAKFELDTQKNMLEKLTAEKRGEYNKASSKITVAMLDSYVNSDTAIIDCKHKVTNLEYKVNLFKSLVTSMLIKKDMLIQLSANNRAETNLYH